MAPTELVEETAVIGPRTKNHHWQGIIRSIKSSRHRTVEFQRFAETNTLRSAPKSNNHSIFASLTLIRRSTRGSRGSLAFVHARSSLSCRMSWLAASTGIQGPDLRKVCSSRSEDMMSDGCTK